jgi:hypothetical protein
LGLIGECWVGMGRLARGIWALGETRRTSNPAHDAGFYVAAVHAISNDQSGLRWLGAAQEEGDTVRPVLTVAVEGNGPVPIAGQLVVDRTAFAAISGGRRLWKCHAVLYHL